MKKLLVTGFEPFGEDKINPTQVLINALKEEKFECTQIYLEVLPVSFKKVNKFLKELFDKIKPDYAIHLGLAGGRSAISIERVAVNIMDARIPDNDNFQPIDEPIIEDGPSAYFSTLPVKEVLYELRNKGIPTVISNSAGLYVCNEVMYLSLYYSDKLGYPAKTGFIHVPYFPEQVVQKFSDLGQNLPSMSFDLQLKAVQFIIKKTLEMH